MAEKDALVDKTVSWTKIGKSGTYPDKKTGEPRKWQMWSFRVEGDERYFTWFENPKTPTPVEGDFIKASEIECGTYTKNDGSIGDSYTAKWITYGTSNAPNQTQGYVNAVKSTQSAPSRQGGTISPKDMSFYQAYAKDILVALVPFNPNYQALDLEDAVVIVAQSGKIMHSLANGGAPEPEPYKSKLGPEDDYPPIGEPPPL